MDILKVNPVLSQYDLSIVERDIPGLYNILDNESAIVTSISFIKHKLGEISGRWSGPFAQISFDEESPKYGPLTRYCLSAWFGIGYGNHLEILVDNNMSIVLCTDESLSYIEGKGIYYYKTESGIRCFLATSGELVFRVPDGLSLHSYYGDDYNLLSDSSDFILYDDNWKEVRRVPRDIFLKYRKHMYFTKTSRTSEYNVACHDILSDRILFYTREHIEPGERHIQTDYNCIYRESVIVSDSNDLLGVLNKNGILVTDFIYNSIELRDGFFVASKDDQRFLVGENGSVVMQIPVEAEVESYCRDSFISFTINNDIYLYDKSFSDCKRISNAEMVGSCGNIIFIRKEFVDEYGYTIPYEYDIRCYDVTDFHFMFCIRSEDVDTFESGYKLKDNRYHEKRKRIMSDGEGCFGEGHYGIVDDLGNVLVPPLYDEIDYFYGPLYRVCLFGKNGIISSKNKIIVPIIYDELDIADYEWNHNDHWIVLAIECTVNGESHLGLIDSEHLILSPKYKDMSPYVDFRDESYGANIRYLYLSDGEKKGVYNVERKRLLDVRFDEIYAWTNFSIIVNNKKYGLIDYDGSVLLPTEYVRIIATPLNARRNIYSTKATKVVRVCISGYPQMIDGKQRMGKYLFPIYNNAEWKYFDVEKKLFSRDSYAVAYEFWEKEAAVKRSVSDDSFLSLDIETLDTREGSVPPSKHYWSELNYKQEYPSHYGQSSSGRANRMAGCGNGWSCSNCPNYGCSANERS